MPQELSDILYNVRNNIIKESKAKWIMLEIITEKIIHLQKLNNIKQIRKQPERPKKEPNNKEKKNQPKL